MLKKLMFVLCSMVMLSAETLAVDLSGRVISTEGTPLCALVLVSGQRQFTCNPNGPFSFTNLPTEPDGSLNLQVFVRGKEPFFEKLFTNEFQTVTLLPAVDDGLTDQRPMDGTYTLMRASASDLSGPLGDSAVGSFVATGTITINNGTYTLNNNIAGSVGSAAGTFQEGFAGVLYDPNTSGEFFTTIIEKGAKWVELATVANGLFVFQWRKVTGPAGASALSALSEPPPAGAMTYGELMLELIGTAQASGERLKFSDGPQ